MKKATLLVAIGLATFAVNAQEGTDTTGETATFEHCSNFFKTPPLRDMMATLEPVDDKKAHLYDLPKPVKVSRYGDPSLIQNVPGEVDPVVQLKNGTSKKGEYRTFLNFTAQFGAFPPDPSGAAGQEYYIQAVNSTYRIYKKEDGGTETPPLPLNTLWDRSGSGDPIIMYDRFAERWFISQFYGEPGGDDNGMLIAVSETSDPLGAYYAYEYDFVLFPDYPKFSVWSNSYFMTANSSSADCCAFEREKMLVGDPTAGVIKMSFPPFFQLFNSVAPAYAEGPREPDADEPGYFFVVQDNAYPGVSTDHILILKAEIDWDNPVASTITESQELNTAAFNSDFPGAFSENITQQGTTQKLDAIPGVFMYRAQYRRFSGYNVMMLCHATNVGGGRAGMRWYELRDSDDGVWAIHQQGTYAPSGTDSRWLGNLAMDAQGNIAMAYSFAGPTNYAGIRYTGRFKDDPLGEMTVPEQIAVEGEGPQTAAGRYGDYSQMSMDPTDDMTFWFTGEFLGAGGSRRTRIFSFSSWHLLGTEESQNKVATLNAYQPDPTHLKITWKNISEDELRVSVMDTGGKILFNENMSGADSEHIIQLSTAASGIYVVRVLGEQTDLSRKIYIAK